MRRSALSDLQHNIDPPEVNLTPLIDVVFVVLIMFMVVAPLLDLDRVQLAHASESPLSLSAMEEQSLLVTVRQDNSVWFDQKQVSFEELYVLLQEAHTRRPEHRLKLLHDHRAQFGTYQSIKNMAEKAGFRELDVILKPA